MKKITVALDEETLKIGLELAQEKGVALSELVTILIKQAVNPRPQSWLEETFTLMDQANVMSNDAAWSRCDLYRN